MHERVFQVVCSAGNPTYSTPMTTRNLGLIIFPSATLEKNANQPIHFSPLGPCTIDISDA